MRIKQRGFRICKKNIGDASEITKKVKNCNLLSTNTKLA